MNKHQELFDRASCPIHRGVLAIANILGDDHPLYKEGQEFRGRLNALISDLRQKSQPKPKVRK